MKRPPIRVVSPPMLAAGAALAASAVRARDGDVRALEARVFQTVNCAPDSLRLPVWAVMQSGSLAAVFVAGAGFARAGRTHNAAVVTVAGTTVWAAVKLVKPLIGRGRPADELSGVRVRGLAQSGLGYPSGHVAVATTLAALAVPAPPAVRQIAAAASGCVVGGTRIYVGAHLPLDVIGGVAIGMLGSQAARAVQDRVT